jgi:hypothetical protein
MLLTASLACTQYILVGIFGLRADGKMLQETGSCGEVTSHNAKVMSTHAEAR